MGLPRWFRSRRNDTAREEGLAAGIGLLTGRLVEARASDPIPCPACGRRSSVTDVIDLVEHRSHLQCQRCRHRWTVDRIDPTAPVDR